MHEGHCFLLLQALALDDVVKEFSPLCVLHDKVDVSLGLYDLRRVVGTS